LPPQGFAFAETTLAKDERRIGATGLAFGFRARFLPSCGIRHAVPGRPGLSSGPLFCVELPMAPKSRELEDQKLRELNRELQAALRQRRDLLRRAEDLLAAPNRKPGEDE
jgi:hypothetical protein